MKPDFFNNVTIEQCITSEVLTADEDGAGIDLQGYEGCLFVANVGVSGDTLSGSVYIELELEESDDDSTYTDVADADLTGFVAGTNDGCWAFIDDPAEDDVVIKCQYMGDLQFVRAVVNVTGTHSNGTPISITAVKTGYKYPPVA